MPSTRGPRTLADDLRTRDDADLARLLRARPDLLTPPPSDTTSLAARATTRASVQRAVDRLSTPRLQVLEVLAALDQPTDLPGLARACGASRAAVERQVAVLRELALVWGSGSALRTVRTVEEVLGPYPAGLGPRLGDVLSTYGRSRLEDLLQDLLEGLPDGAGPTDAPPPGDDRTAVDAVVRLLGDPDRVAQMLQDAPDQARRLLDRLAAGPPVGTVENAQRQVRAGTATSAVDWLLARALLVPVAADRVALPREVAVALRGGRVRDGVDESPPALDTRERDPGRVETAAAGQAVEIVQLVERLVEHWSAAPPPLLRSGGLGVRQLRRAAEVLEVDADHAAFVVELAWVAGLVADDREVAPAWAPTPFYDLWRGEDVAVRWAGLADAWRRTSRVPALVGTRDQRNTVRVALGSDLDRPLVTAVRRDVLAELADLPPGHVPDADGLAVRLQWRSPRRGSEQVRQLLDHTLREAARLGVTGLGALARPGRLLAQAAEPAAVAAELDATLPAPVDHVLLQADLTAVAPGHLEPALAQELALVADVDSRGGATVYRFTPESIRRGLDAGRSAEQVLQLLAERSRTPVPQPLEYLVADVARRHGRVRVGTAGAYLRADDEQVLSEVLADRRTHGLRLRRLAPTVLVAQADPAAVLEVLRETGLAPAAESPEGDVVLRRPDAHRTRPRERPRPVTVDPPAATGQLVEAVVSSLRTGDVAAADRVRHEAASVDVPAVPMMEPAGSLAALRDAAADRRTVWVGIADPGGRTTRRRVEPVTVEGGRVVVLDTALGEVRTLSVHRITGVAEDR